MVEDRIISSIAIFFACASLVLSWRNHLLYSTRRWISWTFWLILGCLVIVHNRFFLSEKSKWTIFGILVLILVLVHVKRFVAQRWQFCAELEAEELAGRGRYEEAI